MTDTGRAEFIDWVRAHCWPLPVRATDDDATHLAPLAELVGSASIVGLGESWHSTAQILAIKNRIVRFLVEQLGFNAVVFEGGLPGSGRVDDYLGGGPGNAAGVLRAYGQPMWLNPETVALVDWLRARNAARGATDKLRSFGIDPAYPGAAIDVVLAFLQRVDPAYQVPHRELLQATGRAFLGVPLDSAAKSAVWGAVAVYEKLAQQERAQLRNAVLELTVRLEQHRTAYSFKTGDQEFEWALRQALVLLQAYDIVSIRSASLTDANIARDFAFAENLVWLRRQFPALKMIVIAHNIHIAREPFRSVPDGPPIPSMGGYLAQWLPNDYVAIGSAVGRGGNSAASDAGLAGVGPAEPAAKLAAASASNDAALEELALEQCLLPVPRGLAWSATARVSRSHLDPQPLYSLEKSFDAIAYVDRITRSAAL